MPLPTCRRPELCESAVSRESIVTVLVFELHLPWMPVIDLAARRGWKTTCRTEIDPLMSDNAQNIGNPGINIVSSTNGTLVLLAGRIDIDSSPVLRDSLRALLLVPNSRRVTVDLSAVNHIDSSGIATLIEALKIARGNKTELSLQGLRPGLLHLLQTAKILALFDGSSSTAKGEAQ